MNTQSGNPLLDPLPGQLLLVVAPRAGGPIMMNLVAHLAGRGPLRVLDGGNFFDLRAISRALRRQAVDLTAALERIQLARAFTCHQMVTLLKEAPAQPVPTLVLDLLSTFYDESVPASESLRLLQTCLGHLRRLNQLAPVAVSARPAPTDSRPELLHSLQAAAGQVWILEPHLPPPPPRLF
ncbi:MAG TPA: hypothetical protein VJ436_07215 [Anaerolineales bacterium]|nr:hypothetical protein [Anaerolineales bacterium]